MAPLGSYYAETGKAPKKFGASQNSKTRWSARISWLLLTIKGSRGNLYASLTQVLNYKLLLEMPKEWGEQMLVFQRRLDKILAELDKLYSDLHEFNRTKSQKKP